MIVIDVDEEIEANVKEIRDRFGAPLADAKSLSGKTHLYYPAARGTVGNGNWGIKQDGTKQAGELRQDKGYVVMSDPAVIAAALPATGDPFPIEEFLKTFPPPGRSTPIARPERGAAVGRWAEGNRNTTLYQFAFKAGLMSDLESLKEAKGWARKAGLDNKEGKQTADNGWRDGQAAQANRILPKKDARAFDVAITLLGYRLRYNSRSATVERQQPGRDTVWKPMDDPNRQKLRIDIEEKFQIAGPKGHHTPFKVGDETARHWLLGLVDDRRVDPFSEYLTALPEWDRVPRLDTWLIELFGCEDTELVRWASRYLFLGAVQRTMEPGCKLDEIPVLYGPQGFGKSSVLQAVLPEPEHFRDSLNFAGSGKEQLESILGAVIVESAELTGLRQADLNGLKAFITRQVDHARLAYRTETAGFPRRCIIVGTTDRRDVLPNDPGGNRRFVVVELKSGNDVEKYMAENRGQLWAEALEREGRGERANLPRSLIGAQRLDNDNFRSSDEWLETMLARLPEARFPDGGLLMADIHGEVKLVPRPVDRLVGTALRQLGWRQEIIKKRRYWFSPGGWTPTEERI